MGAKQSVLPIPEPVKYELEFACYTTYIGDISPPSDSVKSARGWCSNPSLWNTHIESVMNEGRPYHYYRLTIDDLHVVTRQLGDHIKGIVTWRAYQVDISELSSRLLVIDTSDILTNGLHKVDGEYRYSILPIRVGME